MKYIKLGMLALCSIIVITTICNLDLIFIYPTAMLAMIMLAILCGMYVDKTWTVLRDFYIDIFK